MPKLLHRLVALALLAVCGSLVSPPLLHAQESVALVTGCNNVALTYAAGTPLTTIAGQIQPPTALRSIFRFDAGTGRFVAFSPGAPAAVNDYQVVDRRLEAVYICMSAPGLLPGGPVVVVPPPVVAGGIGVISAPQRLVRGQSAEVVIGTSPNIACTGGVNIPAGGTFRFVPVAHGATPAGRLIIKFDVSADDSPGYAYLAVRCADGQEVRLTFTVE